MRNAERYDFMTGTDLKEYKNKVRRFLLKRCGEEEADRLMKLYDEDLEMICKEFEWSPGTAAFAILLGY